MAQQQQIDTYQQKTEDKPRSLIPDVMCPRCRSSMRLAVIEPAGMNLAPSDTLVFECICGFTHKRLAQRP